MRRPSICIVTPALEDANNGNWQTASRWSQMLGEDYRIDLVGRWNGDPADAMIALHARRSADSIARWKAAAGKAPDRPLAVVLTGTDLYRDIASDPSAERSLELADRLVVLHERAIDDVPALYRHKAIACFQSTPARAARPKSQRGLCALMVGHLRAEKAPQTYFDAARQLAARADILLDHIGAALDPVLGAQARSLMQDCPSYRWLGALPHEEVLRRIGESHVLVHSSVMEGGAHVVMEAICSGTPVLASRIPGNVGMLGADYDGYFEPGDAQGLARLIARCRDDSTILFGLAAQCAARAPLFDPARERATLLALMAEMLETNP
ncbi:selenoneine biosynthesis selenosugar synthase SenB [Variovorax sp. PAMC 28711]|uniref:selenoneine biosynthesis selenosugar synthase SenB n=1 Tax=Variovorax sp. PAMC 28711 TaxID=1795631 RepID=UPI00078B23DC|nr:selenoneine biosynthesis selenosugar synthase SenB [Variovorax sp. PAMC 28711]AMM23738.1 glycosyl transferase family 1 [Variovorax sp. PAMC 28711]